MKIRIREWTALLSILALVAPHPVFAKDVNDENLFDLSSTNSESQASASRLFTSLAGRISFSADDPVKFLSQSETALNQILVQYCTTENANPSVCVSHLPGTPRVSVSLISDDLQEFMRQNPNYTPPPPEEDPRDADQIFEEEQRARELESRRSLVTATGTVGGAALGGFLGYKTARAIANHRENAILRRIDGKKYDLIDGRIVNLETGLPVLADETSIRNASAILTSEARRILREPDLAASINEYAAEIGDADVPRDPESVRSKIVETENQIRSTKENLSKTVAKLKRAHRIRMEKEARMGEQAFDPDALAEAENRVAEYEEALRQERELAESLKNEKKETGDKAVEDIEKRLRKGVEKAAPEIALLKQKISELDAKILRLSEQIADQESQLEQKRLQQEPYQSAYNEAQQLRRAIEERNRQTQDLFQRQNQLRSTEVGLRETLSKYPLDDTSPRAAELRAELSNVESRLRSLNDPTSADPRRSIPAARNDLIQLQNRLDPLLAGERSYLQLDGPIVEMGESIADRASEKLKLETERLRTQEKLAAYESGSATRRQRRENRKLIKDTFRYEQVIESIESDLVETRKEIEALEREKPLVDGELKARQTERAAFDRTGQQWRIATTLRNLHLEEARLLKEKETVLENRLTRLQGYEMNGPRSVSRPLWSQIEVELPGGERLTLQQLEKEYPKVSRKFWEKLGKYKIESLFEGKINVNDTFRKAADFSRVGPFKVHGAQFLLEDLRRILVGTPDQPGPLFGTRWHQQVRTLGEFLRKNFGAKIFDSDLAKPKSFQGDPRQRATFDSFMMETAHREITHLDKNGEYKPYHREILSRSEFAQRWRRRSRGFREVFGLGKTGPFILGTVGAMVVGGVVGSKLGEYLYGTNYQNVRQAIETVNTPPSGISVYTEPGTHETEIRFNPAFVAWMIGDLQHRLTDVEKLTDGERCHDELNCGAIRFSVPLDEMNRNLRTILDARMNTAIESQSVGTLQEEALDKLLARATNEETGESTLSSSETVSNPIEP